MAVNLIVQMVTPACNTAVDKAIHASDPDRFHRRITGMCPYCLTLGEKLKQAFLENVSGSEIAEQAKARILASMEAQDVADRQGSEGS